MSIWLWKRFGVIPAVPMLDTSTLPRNHARGLSGESNVIKTIWSV